ncbi:MAG: hypothetical protein REI11_19385 [Patulibacter sp.]|nr:hypothetical protein [Patulibacter sp.]
MGLCALAVIVANAGGPVAYLRNLNATAGINAGLFYVFAVLLLLRWVPTAIIAQRWGSGQRAGRAVVVAFAVGTVLLGLVGTRLFLATAVLEITILGSLLLRPIATRTVVVGGLVVGVVIVFGVGTVKRYESLHAAGTIGNQSFSSYATTTAPKELAAAYVNNYVDSVRLTGLARELVPSQAPYETIRPLKEMLLKPLPSRIRPTLPRSPTIQFVFAPAGDTGYAVPVQVTALLSGGPAVLVVASLVIGWLLALVDRRVLRRSQVSAGHLLITVTCLVEFPVAIRSGIPGGVAIALTDVIGAGLVAWFVLGRPIEGTPDTDPPTMSAPTSTEAPR